MAAPRKVAQDLATKSALAAGTSAAKRAIEDLMSTDQERARMDAERAAHAKRRRTKRIAFGLVGLLLVLGAIGLLLSYWHWFLLLGLLGLVAFYGRYRWRNRRKGQPARLAARAKHGSLQESSERARARDASAREAAGANEAQSIDDELARLKSRFGK
jgi:Flp pilus assembly protein TadB